MKLTPLLTTLIITAFSSNAQINPEVQKEPLFQGKVLQHPVKPGQGLHLNGPQFRNHRSRYFRNYHRSYPRNITSHGWYMHSQPVRHWRAQYHTTSHYPQHKVYYIINNTGYSEVYAPKVRVNQALKVTPANRYQLGQMYNSLPTGAEPITISGQQYFKYHDIYFLAQISGDTVKYLAIKLN